MTWNHSGKDSCCRATVETHPVQAAACPARGGEAGRKWESERMGAIGTAQEDPTLHRRDTCSRTPWQITDHGQTQQASGQPSLVTREAKEGGEARRETSWLRAVGWQHGGSLRASWWRGGAISRRHRIGCCCKQRIACILKLGQYTGNNAKMTTCHYMSLTTVSATENGVCTLLIIGTRRDGLLIQAVLHATLLIMGLLMLNHQLIHKSH